MKIRLAKSKKLPFSECPIMMRELRRFLDEVDDTWNYITPPELEEADKKDFFILDVRKPKDFKKCHIAGAKNIFWLDLLEPKNLAKLPTNKKILTVCYVGHTASQALVVLRLLGYDVVALKFGMGMSPAEGVPVAGWTDYGFDVVRG